MVVRDYGLRLRLLVLTDETVLQLVNGTQDGVLFVFDFLVVEHGDDAADERIKTDVRIDVVGVGAIWFAIVDDLFDGLDRLIGRHNCEKKV